MKSNGSKSACVLRRFYGLSPMFPGFHIRMLATMISPDPRADMPSLNWSDLGVSELPTGTVTLLLADVEDSTRLWETQPRRPKGRRQLGISDTEIDASVQATRTFPRQRRSRRKRMAAQKTLRNQ